MTAQVFAIAASAFMGPIFASTLLPTNFQHLSPANISFIPQLHPHNLTEPHIDPLRYWPSLPITQVIYYGYIEIEHLTKPPNTSATYTSSVIRSLATLTSRSFPHLSNRIVPSSRQSLFKDPVEFTLFPRGHGIREREAHELFGHLEMMVREFGPAEITGTYWSRYGENVDGVNRWLRGEELAMFRVLLEEE